MKYSHLIFLIVGSGSFANAQAPGMMTPGEAAMMVEMRKEIKANAPSGAPQGGAAMGPSATYGGGTSPADPAFIKPDATGKVAATPRLVRDYPVPEVFFNEMDGSYLIPTSDDYNRIMNALNSALSRKVPINMVIDVKTRMIKDIDAPKVDSASSVYEDVPDNSAPTMGGRMPGGYRLPPNMMPGAMPGQPAAAPAKSGWAD